VCFASSSEFLRYVLQFGACRLHSRDHVIDIRGLYELTAIPPEWQRMAIEPSRGVQVIQWSLVCFRQTEQTAAAMQQPWELARLTLADQPPIVDGDVGREALGQAECMRFRDDGCVP
jgi:hypothetical protein